MKWKTELSFHLENTRKATEVGSSPCICRIEIMGSSACLCQVVEFPMELEGVLMPGVGDKS